MARTKLSRRARTVIDQAADIGISTMSCWEVALLHSQGRMKLDRNVREWVGAAVADERIKMLPVSVDIALNAGGLTTLRDPADRIIYATAVETGSRLVSRDAQLKDFDPARVVW